MATIDQVAKAFAEGNAAKGPNASTDGREYRLHGNLIALKGDDGNVLGNTTFYWCGWYGPTTANHLNKIIKALGGNKRVSYAQARDHGVGSFFIDKE
jgi:hypothetical protein